MFIEKQKLSRQEIKQKSNIINLFLIILFILLFFSFWNIQVLKNHYYTTLATRNIKKRIEIKAPRGLILDRSHKRLSENKINFNLFLIREYARNMKHTIESAASFTDTDKNLVNRSIDKYKGFPRSYAIPIKRDLTLSKVIFIESRSNELPEFEINIEPARAYPYGDIASHVLGYISELTPDELEEKKKEDYKLGDLIGKIGIEKKYETYLRGIGGIRTVVKDNLGKIQEILSEEKPLIGSSVVLTIDIELQKYIEEIFKEHNGTVGVVDLKTGGILAMISKPNFNPEFLSGILEKDEWLSLINDPDKPLHNKFLQGLYSPGSVFKIVMALAGLQEKIIDTSTVSLCQGQIKIYNRYFRCWNRSGHGRMNLYDALKNSCNIFFYRLGKKIDIDIIAKYAKLLGLGVLTQVDLPNEKEGLIPTKAWKLHRLKQKWFPGETISVAIGGGMISVTPAQVLAMISTVALRGKMPRLHLLKQIEKNGEVIKEYKPEFKEVPIGKKNFEIVIEGLFKVVNENGTGRAAKIKRLNLCGKTGTHLILSLENPNYAQLVKQKRFMPHSWFASFAPMNNPEIAMIVFVENGGDAGAVAAPIAAKIYRKIFEE